MSLAAISQALALLGFHRQRLLSIPTTMNTKRNLLKRIEVDPRVMLGKPVIRGTRITVEIILEKLAADIPIEEIIRDYPRLTREDVLAAVAYAREALGTEEIIPRVAARR